jgi:catechol 2,3-dioxygenase-like lactoylglutathione lyase family enzyme
MDRLDLDHVALAASDTAPALQFLTGTLGGTVIFGGQAIGFRPMQVWLGDDAGDGMSVELLEPWATERNDFLARFVARHGAGPHHLTFKVPDLLATLDRLRGSGFNPVNVDLSDRDWKEAFLLPRQAHGTVVQLAETSQQMGSRAELLEHVRRNGPNEHPRWWADPEPHEGPPAKLRRVVLRTPNLTSAVAFFGGQLQGDITEDADEHVDLAWPGGARIRLVACADAPPGVDRLDVEGLHERVEVIGTTFEPVSA